jgi:tetratricopeptide (TPR) repeat protein
VADHHRIEELRRRIDKDPASIAFAQLAEEYRRAGQFAEAIRVSRAGLLQHPGYLSARVTLGRALIEKNDLDAAKTELETVLRAAPENLAAIRGLAEIHHRRGALQDALDQYQVAMTLVRHDPDIEGTIRDLERELSKTKPPTPTATFSIKDLEADFLNAVPAGASAAAVAQPPSPPVSADADARPARQQTLPTHANAAAPQPARANPEAAADRPALEVQPHAVRQPPPPVMQGSAPVPASAPAAVVQPEQLTRRDPRLAALESFLHAIVSYRASRQQSSRS